MPAIDCVSVKRCYRLGKTGTIKAKGGGGRVGVGVGGGLYLAHFVTEANERSEDRRGGTSAGIETPTYGSSMPRDRCITPAKFGLRTITD